MVIGPNGNRKRKSNERRTTILNDKKKCPYVHKLGEAFDEHINVDFKNII
jgi:hypothetical protein